MPEDRLDEILKDICRQSGSKLEGIEDIHIPEFDQSMETLKQRIYKKRNNTKWGWGSKFKKVGRMAAVVVCLFVFSFIFSIINEIPQVDAFKFRVVKTLFKVENGITHIQQSSQDDSDIPKGKVPPPPPPDADPSESGNTEGQSVPKGEAPIKKIVTLDQAIKEVPYPVLVPEYIPQGYILQKVELEQSSMTYFSIQQEYKNDQGNEIIIRQRSGAKAFARSAGTPLPTKKIKVMGEDAILITDGTSYCSTFWAKDQSTFDIDARVSEEEFMKFLGNLKLVT